MKLEEQNVVNVLKKYYKGNDVKHLLWLLGTDEDAQKIWEESKNYKEFEECILNQDLVNTHIYPNLYAFISENGIDRANHWYRVRALFGDVLKTYSDVGSLKVGSGCFHCLIHNGYGDGTTRVGIIEKDDPFKRFVSSMMQSTNIDLSGDIDIYDYDCGNDVVKTIHGTYSAYYYDGMIALVEA